MSGNYITGSAGVSLEVAEKTREREIDRYLVKKKTIWRLNKSEFYLIY